MITKVKQTRSRAWKAYLEEYVVGEHTAYGFILDIFKRDTQWSNVEKFGFVISKLRGTTMVIGENYPSYDKALRAGRSEARKEAGG